jgi:predicted alpha/beta superfamily hydrolase
MKNPATAKKTYPVLYLNDGQNLFEASTSVFNPMEWQVDETVRALLEKKEIAPLIVVGIDNAGRSERANEYLPFEDKFLQPPLPNPEGNKYPDFLTQEVMPLINQCYRTKTGAKNTVLGGSSYGALISLYVFIKKPEVFGSLLLESPSFYVSDAQILKEAETLRKLPRKIYLGVGTNEGGRANCTLGNMETEAVQDVLKLKRILQDKKLKNKHLKIVIEDCSVPNENAWAKRLPEALKFLYKK